MGDNHFDPRSHSKFIHVERKDLMTYLIEIFAQLQRFLKGIGDRR